MKFLRVMGLCFLVAGSAVCFVTPILRLMGGIWIGVGVLLIVIAQKAAAAAAHRQRLLQTGKVGEATILHVADTGVTINNNPRVRLKVRIQVPGEAPIEATNAMMVSRVGVPRVGEVYDVRFDPKNPNDFAFASASSRSSAPSGGDDVIGQLERLTALRDKGALSPDEFEAQKRKVLGET
jgi:hypothetical protein